MAANKKVKKASKIKDPIKPQKTNKGSTLNNLIKNVKNAVGLAKNPTSNKKITPLEKINNPFNKSQLIATLAERTDVSKKQAALLLNELFNIMGHHLKKGSAEKFVFPGAFKIVVRKTAAKKARNGINPFTGEPAVFKAKPAARKVKIIPLKSLKDMAV